MSKQTTEHNFIEFTGTDTRAGRGGISITKSKNIGLSARFCQEHHIHSFPYVTLYYDPDRRAIALRFTKQRYDTRTSDVNYCGWDRKGQIVA